MSGIFGARSGRGVISGVVGLALVVALATGVACKKTCHGVLLPCEDDRCIDPNTSAQHCGACGHACASTSSCIAGKCTVRSCSSGTADCDGNDANGCETKLDTNDNCGACNAKCDGTCSGICYRAVVSPVTLGSVEANERGLVLFGYESGHTGHYYFLADGAREPTSLAVAQVNDASFAVTATDVYFPATINEGGNFVSGIFKIDAVRPSTPLRVGGSAVARNPVATTAYIVYSDWTGTESVLMGVPLAGGSPRKIAALEATHLTADGANVVVATKTSIVRIDPASGKVTTLADGTADDVWSIDGAVYFRRGEQILQAPPSGTTPIVKMTLRPDRTGPVGVEPRGVVWTKGGKSKPGPLTDTIIELEPAKVIRTSWDGVDQDLPPGAATCVAFRRGALYVGSGSSLWMDKLR